ncbi:hypothetical protein, partial [Tropicimonas sp. IMCC6043]|uniref:hypothetical protein n=1 Tax=Tropicimonas sp. IMCC6043 TaxID=2510645 RepID=UPI001A92FAF8
SDKGPVRGIGCSPKAFPFEKRCHGVVQAAPWPSTKPNLGKTGSSRTWLAKTDQPENPQNS